MDLDINIHIPFLWGDQLFKKNTWGDINFIVGPNGTGKTMFAEQLKSQLTAHNGIRPRYLSAERLSGLEKGRYTYFTESSLMRGFNTGNYLNYKTSGCNCGLSLDAFISLKEKIDLRIRIEATLSQLFGRRIRLVEDGGYLKPMVQKIHHSEEYDLKESECHGLKELITLLTIIHDDEYNCLIIDEPELHLHPQFQMLFLQEVRKIAGDPRKDPNKKLFFIITHSPYFIDIRTPHDLKNCLIFQPDRLPSYIDHLEGDDEWKIKRLIPRLNTHHKQFFFASNPIFVEGYTDQQLFTLIQEKRGKMLGASGACIIDAGGKEELDIFYRLCKNLNINAHFITDLDALFKGNLRQSVSRDERCKSYLQSEGSGPDALVVFGQMMQQVSDCLKDLEPNLFELEAFNSRSKQFCEILSQTTELDIKRYIFIIGLNNLGAEIESLIPSRKGDLKLITARLQKIIDAFKQCGVYLLPSGELENHLVAYDGNPYQISDKAKNQVFEAERDFILNASSCEEIDSRYEDIKEILDQASSANIVDIYQYLNYAIGDWIYKIQSAFIREGISDKESLIANPITEWKIYSRIFELIDFTKNSNDFICRIRLKPTIDPSRKEVKFSKDTLAAGFKLDVS